ncbi:MAG: pilus assembly PilX N-terminal domain-containing protein [Candidatus Gracilibacteria bacterium]
MIKIVETIWRNKKGTALLTAMLIMGVLITISIALSSLVMREVRVTKDLMDAGKAFYAAESGVEEALYFLNNKLPGWQTERKEDGKPDPVVREFGAEGNKNKFQYFVKNQCTSYPCIDEEYNLGDGTQGSEPPPESFYDVMDLNENVLIPLFVVGKDEEGTEVIKPVENFTVEFYGMFNPLTDLKVGNALSGWDVLRWKVFGMKKHGQDFGTESISDFSAFASDLNNGAVADAANPSWFGTVACDAVPDDSRVTDSIICHLYESRSSSGGSCQATDARDYYGLDDAGDLETKDCWGIGQFLNDHQVTVNDSTGLNYLSLTNIMNPAMLVDSIENKENYSKIYFRVETYDDLTVREVAEIVSDGYAGNSKQSIKVMKKRDSYMPVFNFSIYSTYGSDGTDDEGKNYYYDNRPQALPGN